MADNSTTVADQRQRANRAWQLHSGWDHLYQDAHDYVIPFRKTGGQGTNKAMADVMFDMIGPNSAMHLAGQLHRILFSQPPQLAAGPLVRVEKARYGKKGLLELDKLDRELERTGEFIYPFMEAGDLGTVGHEACIDLGFGTGIIIPMRGTPDRPVIFHAPGAHEVALQGDMYGQVCLASWRRNVERKALLDAMPEGKFSTAFKEAAKTGGTAEVQLYQDFYKLPDGRWKFCAYMDSDCDEFIAEETYRTKPIATPRLNVVAGEMRGRGPILLALPGIKVQNKAQELVLKAAALQMIGIWGYRANSGFNPDTAPMEPGAFWSMQSTGGILGPDITRLDPASGNLNIASMLLQGNGDQIRDALMDTRLRPTLGTPKSASEIAGLLQQAASANIGGIGRAWRESYPDIVPRVAEILNSFGYLGGVMDFNRLFVSIGVRSPIAGVVEADKAMAIARYAEMMNAFDPGKLPEHLIMDDASDDIAKALMIPKRLVPDVDQRLQIRQALQQQQQQAMAAQMAVKAAPNLAAGALSVIQGGQGQAAA
jgi:Bacteriophage head to tail connecting protein